MVSVTGFEPYFYIPCPKAFNFAEPNNIRMLIDCLNNKAHAMRTVKETKAIKRIEPVVKEDL